MTSLPQITFNGYTFTPKQGTVEIIYSIVPGKGQGQWEVTNWNWIEKNKVGPEKNVELKDDYIDQGLNRMKSLETSKLLCVVVGLISVVAGYLFVAKKNYKFSVISAVSAGILACVSWKLNVECRRIAFRIANGILTAYEEKPALIYKEVKYDV